MKCSKSWATLSPSPRSISPNTRHGLSAGRDDLLARYKVPLDEYPKRCVEQLANWHQELESYKRGSALG